MRTIVLAWACVMLAAGAARAEEGPADPPLRWWKGNLHTHTLWSDGNGFPEMVADWYRERGYHFLAISDHNVLNEGIRWMRVADVERRAGAAALPAYRARFGDAWVEQRGEPGTPEHAVRLKPMSEYRALLEERGRFLLLQSEEISDRMRVHLNAANLRTPIPPQGGDSTVEILRRNLQAVQAEADRTGRDLLAHINHPNWGWGLTAEDLAAAREGRLFEVYNAHPGVRHRGDAVRPSVEAMWDIANTLRLLRYGAPPLIGLATDDSHHYQGRGSVRPGRGWVMVRARHLTPESLFRAIRAGDLYASSGVELREVRFDAEAGVLALEIEPDGDAVMTTQFIGTPRDVDMEDSEPRVDADGAPLPAATRRYSERVGMVLHEATGLSPRYELTGEELYVRAVITSSRPHPDPSFRGQRQQAWTQPVGWERHAGELARD